MRAIKCSSCGGNDLLKIGNTVTCQFCGTKYILDDNENILSVVETERKVTELIFASAT